MAKSDQKKRAGKRRKPKQKKVRVKRTQEERKEDVLSMLMELERLEIPKSYEPYQDILTVCNKYIDDGEYAEGIIKLTAYDRHFVYMFPEFQPGKIQAMLRYVGKKKPPAKNGVVVTPG
jgi:hypothetical protein